VIFPVSQASAGGDASTLWESKRKRRRREEKWEEEREKCHTRRISLCLEARQARNRKPLIVHGLALRVRGRPTATAK